MTHSNPPTRRAFLASGLAGAGTGVAGCLDRIPLLGGEQPPPFGPVEHSWGMAGRDAVNTASNPGS
ncbi:Twin arginine translocation signal domain containing protein [Halorhabdus tiamatea SARL4B]|uniref:Twin arginine translocation signal domain containing protein n=1 Tax=Halorhabdus tiamatea SARL4B TaxID=1033806 RepID=U2E1X8_9EURY|nr:hypothetical protein [Halorhabdus tiamatea]ERJ05971.1 Twin arginine translocation signal domain containing protein [Halorhabdus tiamatea SARL4B]